jgi:DNA-binding LytR/AlgR family response regulator
MKKIVPPAVPPEYFPLIYRGIVWVLLSVLLTIAGPYSEQIGFGYAARFGYWAIIIALTIVLGLLVRYILQGRRQDVELGLEIATALAQAVTLGPVIWLVNNLVFGFMVSSLVWLAEFTLVVLIVAICLALIRYELSRIRRFALADQGAVAMPSTTSAMRPAFLDRFDDPLPGDLVQVSADDHYLEVYTTEGKGRILMRFRDALEELDDLPGFRIHRSHWVARKAISGVRSYGRRHVAVLRDGRELPVSQNYLDDLRAAGLLDERGMGSRTGVGANSTAEASAPIRADNSGRSQ